MTTMPQEQALVFPIMVKVMTDQETKEYHLKKLYDLSNKPGELDFKVDGSIRKNGKPLAEDPTYEQKQWFVRKMKAQAWNTSIEHKPWIFRWHYFVLGDYQNG